MADSRRPTGIRERLDDDEVLLGVLDDTYSPSLVELYGELGLDFVWLDLEHAGPSPWHAPAVEELLRAAELVGVEPVLRLPTTDPSAVRKALDAGARTMFLPRVESAEEVRRAVRASRFRYDGEAGHRGLANPRASRWGTVDDYVDAEDEDVLVGATVETRAAVEEIDEILAVPDLGFVFLGPLDLSVSLGHPGEFDHPEVEEALEEVRSAAVDAGVPVGGLGFGMDDVTEKARNGYQILHVGSTTGALKAATADWLDGYEGP